MYFNRARRLKKQITRRMHDTRLTGRDHRPAGAFHKEVHMQMQNNTYRTDSVLRAQGKIMIHISG